MNESGGGGGGGTGKEEGKVGRIDSRIEFLYQATTAVWGFVVVDAPIPRPVPMPISTSGVVVIAATVVIPPSGRLVISRRDCALGPDGEPDLDPGLDPDPDLDLDLDLPLPRVCDNGRDLGPMGDGGAEVLRAMVSPVSRAMCGSGI